MADEKHGTAGRQELAGTGPEATGRRDGDEVAAVTASSGATGAEADATPKKISLAARVYGALLIAMGVLELVLFVLVGAVVGFFAFLAASDPETFAPLISEADALLGRETTLAIALLVISLALTLVGAVLDIRVGYALLRNSRRKVALRVRVLLVVSVLALVNSIMLNGISTSLIPSFVELSILIALSIRIDPTLRAERRAERKANEAENAEAAAKGMEGRDLTGKGYLSLNFFNLFWEFVVCCVLGLVLEIVWHMTVVDPGVYEDRAGLLYGPFSPIYGFGAVLVTLALNRLYDKNPGIIFAVSAVVGGAFEAAVSLFMQYGFGATAWDYSDYMILGFHDPIAVFSGGRTSTMFVVMWGVLGLVWVKAFLPLLLKVVNLIPWKLRYWLTSACALLMIVNGTMTLMSLDCWFERESGVAPTTPAGEFFATYYDNDWMAHRFESMTITPENSTRIDTALGGAVAGEGDGSDWGDTGLVYDSTGGAATSGAAAPPVAGAPAA